MDLNLPVHLFHCWQQVEKDNEKPIYIHNSNI